MVRRSCNETHWDFVKKFRKKNEIKKFSARYVRNLFGYCRYRNQTTKEIVSKLYNWHGIICIFCNGNMPINTDANGIPLEKISQKNSVILIPIKREQRF